ncbi:unnamed protein product [Urochloa decumbens]|uniref:Rx N-terminal domain-containing protein n=1 Tax=Urochloa decumbens TaxID=240449 RepID=A0ABC9FNF7_9POAL
MHPAGGCMLSMVIIHHWYIVSGRLTVLTAILAEIANRSISFLIGKWSKEKISTNEDQMIHNLQQLLCRVRVIIEEAEARKITNQAMLHQLNILRKEMYRGYFTMDNFRSKDDEEYKSKYHDVSHPFSLSKFNPAKRLFFSTGVIHGEKELQQVVYNLNEIIGNMREFTIFLKNYPLLYRQPYSMHLILDKCMFGRQMEMDRIMNYLMLVEPTCTKHVGVLPIVGPAVVGKSTLIAHVCNDERVRNNFTKIVLTTQYDLKDKGLMTLDDGAVVYYQHNSLNENERTLSIIEFSEDIDEASWKSYLASATCHASVVKIIITSRSNRIINFGTTQALILNLLPPEAYWYFFKVLTFGSADPKDQPKLESMAMEISRGSNRSFVGANFISGLLRDHLHGQYGCMVRASLRGLIATRTSSCAPVIVNEKNPMYGLRIATNECFAIYPCPESFADDMIPETTLFELVYGTVKCQGKFEVLALKSRIPPYKNYMYTCEMLNSYPLR